MVKQQSGEKTITITITKTVKIVVKSAGADKKTACCCTTNCKR